jgi:hypothetical protein
MDTIMEVLILSLISQLKNSLMFILVSVVELWDKATQLFMLIMMMVAPTVWIE